MLKISSMQSIFTRQRLCSLTTLCDTLKWTGSIFVISQPFLLQFGTILYLLMFSLVAEYLFAILIRSCFMMIYLISVSGARDKLKWTHMISIVFAQQKFVYLHFLTQLDILSHPLDIRPNSRCFPKI